MNIKKRTQFRTFYDIKKPKLQFNKPNVIPNLFKQKVCEIGGCRKIGEFDNAEYQKELRVGFEAESKKVFSDFRRAPAIGQ